MQSRHNASVDGTRLDHGILVPLHTQCKCDPYNISLHMTELLSHFGPTTAWRCWVFERYNHMLQNIQTNGRFGSWFHITQADIETAHKI